MSAKQWEAPPEMQIDASKTYRVKIETERGMMPKLQTACSMLPAEGMKVHTKDYHSRRGLELLVSQRKALLGYLKRSDPGRHAALIARLGIRK